MGHSLPLNPLAWVDDSRPQQACDRISDDHIGDDHIGDDRIGDDRIGDDQ